MAKRKISREKELELYGSVIPIASEFRKQFLDENSPVQDSFKTLEKLGFFIVRFPANNNLSGFHIKKGKLDCIFVNSAQPLSRQFFSAWHECYHAYTGEGSGSISIYQERELDEIEFKAECFAGCILMPEDLIRAYIKNNVVNFQYISYEYLIRMQNYFNVSLSALLTRLNQIFPEHNEVIRSRFGLTNAKRIDELHKRTSEVIGDLSLITPTNDFSVSQALYEKIHENLLNDRISIDKAQSILDMLDSIENKYGS